MSLEGNEMRTRKGRLDAKRGVQMKWELIRGREAVSVHCEKCQSNSAKRLAPPSRGPVGQAYVPVDSSRVMGNVDLNVVTFL